MRFTIVALGIVLCAVTAGQGAVRYRLGKAPRTEFKIAGESYKIDPNVTHAKRVRSLPPDEFDPMRRGERVPEFYRGVLKERYDECMRLPHRHCGPFRWEFVYWTHHWPLALRVRWAWHHRRYIDELLWAQWMAEADFAAEIRLMEAQHVLVQDGYMPAEFASTSPLMIYNNEYLDAVYNPVPFLAVLNLTGLKADPQNDWIGKAAAQSLVAQLSAMPGMFVVEQERVASVLQKQRKSLHTAPAEPIDIDVAQVGRALDAEQVVMGNYVADGDHVLFNLRIVDAETGKVLNGISKAVPRDHVLEALPEFATALAGSLNPKPVALALPPAAPADQPPTVHHKSTRSPTDAEAQLPDGAIESEMVGGNGGRPFVHIDQAQGPVIGFRYSMGHWARRDVLRQLDPIFANSTAVDDPRTTTIMARDGYVVGGLLVDTDGINAVAVRVMFVLSKDGHPDLAHQYATDWIGMPSGISQKILASHGERVLGTFGHKGLNLDAVGLILAATPAQGPQPLKRAE